MLLGSRRKAKLVDPIAAGISGARSNSRGPEITNVFRCTRGIPKSTVSIRLRTALAAAAVGYTFAGCGINAIPTQEEKAKAAWSEVLAEHFPPGADNRDELPDKLVVM